MKRGARRLLSFGLKKRRRWKLFITSVIAAAALVHLSAKLYPKRRGTVNVFTVHLLRDGTRLRAATKYTEAADGRFDTEKQMFDHLANAAEAHMGFVPTDRSAYGYFIDWRWSYKSPLYRLTDSSNQFEFDSSKPWDIQYASDIDRYDEISDTVIWLLQVEENMQPWPRDPQIAGLGGDKGTIEVLRRRLPVFSRIDPLALALEIIFFVLLLWSYLYLATGLARAPGNAKRRRRMRKGLCPECGYDRTGLADSTVCPECAESPPTRNAAP